MRRGDNGEAPRLEGKPSKPVRRARCNCEGCRRERLGFGGFQPCGQYEFGPRPDRSAAHDKESSGFALIPMVIFSVAIGMAMGKYVLS